MWTKKHKIHKLSDMHLKIAVNKASIHFIGALFMAPKVNVKKPTKFKAHESIQTCIWKVWSL